MTLFFRNGTRANKIQMVVICDNSVLILVCGGDLRGQNYGTIRSPGYPGPYPVNRDCIWTVRVASGMKIQFAFGHLALENHPNCTYDFLEVSTSFY